MAGGGVSHGFILRVLVLAGSLLATPQAALALDFTGTVPDQTWNVGTPVNLTLPATKAAGLCTGAHMTYKVGPTPTGNNPLVTSLPAGLSCNASTRVVSGTPTTVTATDEYTYSGFDQVCYETATQTFNVTVAAEPDIKLSKTNVSVTEGGASQTYTVKLKTAPANNLTVTVTSSDSGAVTVSPTTLTFTPTTYNTAQTVTVTAVQDTDGSDESVTVTHAASGLGSVTLTAAVTDDDKGITFNPATSLDLPEGTSRTYTVELRGRGLLSHAAEGFRDHGFSGSLSWQQQPDSDLGAMLSLTRTVGGSPSGGADALLSHVTLEGLAANDTSGNNDVNQSLDLQFGYGFPTLWRPFYLHAAVGSWLRRQRSRLPYRLESGAIGTC